MTVYTVEGTRVIVEEEGPPVRKFYELNHMDEPALDSDSDEEREQTVSYQINRNEASFEMVHQMCGSKIAEAIASELNE